MGSFSIFKSRKSSTNELTQLANTVPLYSDDEPFKAFSNTNSPLQHVCHRFATTGVDTSFVSVVLEKGRIIIH